LFPFVIHLTPEARQAMLKMGNDKHPLVTKVLDYAQADAPCRPALRQPRRTAAGRRAG